MAPRRPSMFIGSSAEGLKIAKALQVNLDRVCETMIWSQGVFGLGNGTLEELARKAPEFDFATLLLTPDDLTTSREHQYSSPRDNVVFEAGLFIGVLGRTRTFLMYDRAAKPKLPSDLAGITLADYEIHATGNIQASIGAASTQIEEAVAALGLREDERLKADITTSTQFQIISDLLDKSMHQFLILMFEQNTSLRRESILSDGIAYVYTLGKKGGGQGFFSVSKMCDLLPDAGLLQPDLRQNITLTERGREFAKWLLARGCKADYFQSELGSWGSPPTNLPENHPWSFNSILRERERLRDQRWPLANPQPVPATPSLPSEAATPKQVAEKRPKQPKKRRGKK